RLEHHLPSTIVPYHTMRNRCACQRYRLQAFFGFVYRLANRLGHFIGFPQANTNTASAVTNHHQGTEAKASSTLDDLRDTIDMNNFINIFCLFSKFLSHPRSLSSARTYTLRLELQPFFACPKRNRFNTPVIEKAVAIKNYLLYPMLQR